MSHPHLIHSHNSDVDRYTKPYSMKSKTGQQYR